MSHYRKTYTVEPQAATGRGGFAVCLPHEAERWAVLEVLRIRKRGKNYQRTRVLGHRPSRSQAQALCATLIAASRPLSRPRLGARFARTGRAIIARGLGRDFLPPKQES